MASVKLSYKNLKKGDFVNLFPFNEDSARSIVESMKKKGYDKTQVIHVAKILEEPETIENPIRIDGAHRFCAATKTGFEDKPLYCLSLQTHRRNLSKSFAEKKLKKMGE